MGAFRRISAALAAVVLAATSACADSGPRTYGAAAARIGESLAVVGWNISVTNLRWDDDYVLVDVTASTVAAPGDSDAVHAKPGDIRFGLYGALAHPIEATALGSCDLASEVRANALSAPAPDRLTGTICLGPLRERSAVRGVYVYSPADRMPGTTVAYPAAYPVGVLPTPESDTGLVVKATSVEAWRADGKRLAPTALGDPAIFTGNGYMLLGLVVDAVAAQYRDDAVARGGPMMLIAAPTLPGVGLNPACATYGSSVLILPEASLNSVHISTSLCTQGEINAAVLYATLSVVGTHAAVWTTHD